MTEQTPTPSDSTATELTAPVAAAPARRSLTRIAVVGIAAAVVIAGGGAAFAVFKKLDGGGSQPHDVLPSSVIAYARIDLDPSAGQKIALLKLIRKFPDAAKSIGIKSVNQDVRKLIFDKALSEDNCDLKYDADIKPWIGNRLGFGLEKDAKTALVAVQVSNEGKAKKGIAALAKCGGGEAPGVSFLDGYAVVAEKQSIADKAVKDAKVAPLADDKTFVEDFKDLGDQGIASVWADTLAITAAQKDGDRGLVASGATGLDGLRSAAATLRAHSTSLDLSAIAHTDASLGNLKPATLTTLPDDTALALSISGGGERARKSFDSFVEGFKGEGENIDSELASLKKEFGFALPEDLETLLGDSITLAIGARNLETLPTLSSPADLANLDIGLSLVSDPSKARNLADRLVALAGQFDVPLSATSTATGAVIATNADAAKSLGGGGALGKDDTFSKVVPDADKAFGALYVNIGAILAAVTKSDPPPEVAKQIDQLSVLSAFGGSVSKKSDHVVQGNLRLTFTK